MWNVELPLELLDSILRFSLSYLNIDSPKSSLFVENTILEVTTVCYPKQVAFFVGNSNFLNSMFRLASDFSKSIFEEINKWLYSPEAQNEIARSAKRVSTNLKYYKQVLELLGQISKMNTNTNYKTIGIRG